LWRCPLSVAGLVLAAGSGRRLGSPKALLRYQDTPLVERAAWTLHDAGCAPVVVVLGASADRVTAETDLSKVTVVVNKAWGTGQGSSLRAGLRAVEETDVAAFVVMPVDMPGVTAEAVRRVAGLPHREALACATYQGRRSHPVLVGRAHWAGVSMLANADVGLRPYLLARSAQVTEIACDAVAAGDDVDTPDDAARLGIELPA
jgi:molybdenum cofactor cytidylyltransferase/nicotine blue oxidoreductase